MVYIIHVSITDSFALKIYNTDHKMAERNAKDRKKDCGECATHR